MGADFAPYSQNKGQFLPPILKIRGNFCPLSLLHAIIGGQNYLCCILCPVALHDLMPEHFIMQNATHIVVSNLHRREVSLQRSADGLNHPIVQEQLTDYVLVEYTAL